MAGGYRKIKRVSLVDQASERIRRHISDNDMKDGDRLPSEAEFAQMFGVNRLTVRMALQKLSTVGLVETRVGEGSFVSEAGLGPLLKEFPDGLFSGYSLEEIFQLRRMLEFEAVKAAIRLADADDINELRELAYESERVTISNVLELSEERLNEMVEADLRFHLKLVAVSRNKVFTDVYNMFLPQIRTYIRSIQTMRINLAMESSPEVKSRDSYIHSELVGAIEERSWKRCKEILARMIEYAFFQPEELGKSGEA